MDEQEPHLDEQQPVEPVEEDTPPSTPPSNTKILIGVAVGLAALIAIGVGTYFFQYQMSNDSAIDISDWKTYVYHNNLWTFRYPKEWTLYDSKTPQLKDNEVETIVSFTSADLRVISISFCASNPENERCERVKIKNNIEVIIDWGVDGTTTVLVPYTVDAGIFITLHKVDLSTQQLFRQLLSTFEFIESPILDTSDWKTYINTKYNYQIKYPEKDWYFDWLVEPDFPETVDAVSLTKVTIQENEYVDQSVLHMRISVSAAPNPNNLTPKEWYYFVQYNIDIPAGLSPALKMSEKQLIDLKERVKKEISFPKGVEELTFNEYLALRQTYEQWGLLSFVKDSYIFSISWSIVDGKEQPEQAEKIFNQILSTFKFIEPEEQSMSSPPAVVTSLCFNKGEKKFVTEDGQRHTFFESAESVQRCNAGNIWGATEDSTKVNDAAGFLFDVNGVLLDICQPLFWRSGCERFKDISCEKRNYCE